MIIGKEFRCTVQNIDKVVVELAKEIENGWHIQRIKNHDFELSSVLNSYPEFSVTLVRKED